MADDTQMTELQMLQARLGEHVIIEQPDPNTYLVHVAADLTEPSVRAIMTIVHETGKDCVVDKDL